MKPEKPQKGNPYQLTVSQHCFPKRSIDRFAADGLVDTHIVRYERTVRMKSSADLFCVSWVWDQRAEASFMKEIEDAYQDLGDMIADGTVVKIPSHEHKVVSDMYALWNLRWHWSTQPIEDQRLEGVVAVQRQLSTDEQEELEKKGITAIRPDLTISGRHVTSIRIQQDLFDARKHMRNVRWGILRSTRYEFIVPDNSLSRLMLPVTPQICLIAREGYGIADKYTLIEINTKSIKDSNTYYFARDLSKCPMRVDESSRRLD